MIMPTTQRQSEQLLQLLVEVRPELGDARIALLVEFLDLLLFATIGPAALGLWLVDVYFSYVGGIYKMRRKQLRERIDQLETGRPPSAISSRPGSRERLPPMEGLPGEMMPMGLDGTEPPPPAAEPAPEAAPEPVAPEPETEPEA